MTGFAPLGRQQYDEGVNGTLGPVMEWKSAAVCREEGISRRIQEAHLCLRIQENSLASPRHGTPTVSAFPVLTVLAPPLSLTLLLSSTASLDQTLSSQGPFGACPPSQSGPASVAPPLLAGLLRSCLQLFRAQAPHPFPKSQGSLETRPLHVTQASARLPHLRLCCLQPAPRTLRPDPASQA